jgi:hypothetical protein
VRLFLPALGFQCVLVGVGLQRVVEILSGWLASAGRPWVEALTLIAVLAPAGAASAHVHPYQLSYVNFFAGGVAGADARGLEVTNLKEVLSPSVVEDLEGIIPPGSVVDPGFMTEEICFYRASGQARNWVVESWLPPHGDEPGETLTCGIGEMLPHAETRPARDPDFVLILNREAVWRPMDRALFLYGDAPAYEIRLDGVPLVRAYRTR